MEISGKTVRDVEIVFINGRLDAYNSNLVEEKLDKLIDLVRPILLRIYPEWNISAVPA
ncbi:hypothetical protein [Methanobacterium sp.]|jgi:anti-anti-sigma regulatory factor|uniref:hypothetical protein n=1 Tax=Methanobacterium sp. TaxID=2164 RepID=UPI00258F56AC|nr:hypothetical protein [Methanobacterium sp.]